MATPLGQYDDGSAEVPGGLTGRVERVIVVGAGIAGLTVANALAQAGIEYVVLEARDRIGGRLHTIDLAGVPVDLGGSWIHHPVGNPLRRLAEQAGVACCPVDPLATLGAFDATEGRWLSRAELDAFLELEFEQLPAIVEHLQGEVGPEASAAQAIDRLIEQSSLRRGGSAVPGRHSEPRSRHKPPTRQKASHCNGCGTRWSTGATSSATSRCAATAPSSTRLPPGSTYGSVLQSAEVSRGDGPRAW